MNYYTTSPLWGNKNSWTYLPKINLKPENVEGCNDFTVPFNSNSLATTKYTSKFPINNSRCFHQHRTIYRFMACFMPWYIAFIVNIHDQNSSPLLLTWSYIHDIHRNSFNQQVPFIFALINCILRRVSNKIKIFNIL